MQGAWKLKVSPEQMRKDPKLRKMYEEFLQNYWIYNRHEMDAKLNQIKETIFQLLYAEQDTSEACSSDRKCDIAKALPMMTGLVWYQVKEMIFQIGVRADSFYINPFKEFKEPVGGKQARLLQRTSQLGSEK